MLVPWSLHAAANYAARRLSKGHLMRICRINRGSLKDFLCRYMHDEIIQG
jgi:hypothetical protein